MISVQMLRYHNAHTKNMTEAQLHQLKLKVEFMDNQFKEINGYSNYENILLSESERLIESEAICF